jgi:hypothetical protein
MSCESHFDSNTLIKTYEINTFQECKEMVIKITKKVSIDMLPFMSGQTALFQCCLFSRNILKCDNTNKVKCDFLLQLLTKLSALLVVNRVHDEG